MSDELTAILDEMVVFGFEDGTYSSNSPYWNDPRLRKAWIKRHGQKNEPEPVVEEVDEEEVDYNTFTNEELRTELARRGLSVDGKKAEMVSRLEENDAAEE